MANPPNSKEDTGFHDLDEPENAMMICSWNVIRFNFALLKTNWCCLWTVVWEQ